VTGGAGFVGSHLTDALVARGDRVVVLDDLSTGREENLGRALASGRVEFVEGSTSDATLVDACMCDVDRCAHVAAAVGMKIIMSDPLSSLLSNVRGVDTVMESASRHGRRLLFVSTSEVYGKLVASPLSEGAGCVFGSPFRTRWSYAIAKSFGEAVAHAYVRDRRAEIIVVRLFNAVGARQTGAYGMVLPRFVGQALAGEPLSVYGDGSQARCFTSVRDVTRGIVDLFSTEAALGHVYNLGSSRPVVILDLARRVIERTGSASTVRFVPFVDVYGDDYEEILVRVSDSTAVGDLTGWRATRTVDEMIDEVIADKQAAIGSEAHGGDGGRFTPSAARPGSRVM
jgi:UDP-glucose 4-epimerase